jgi:hypothetical protein
MVCPNCRSESSEKDDFCGDCGSRLTLSPPSPPASRATVSDVKHTTKKALRVGLLGLIGLGLAGGLVFAKVRHWTRHQALVPTDAIVVRFSDQVLFRGDSQGHVEDAVSRSAAPENSVVHRSPRNRSTNTSDAAFFKAQRMTPTQIQPYQPLIERVEPYQSRIQAPQSYAGQSSTIIRTQPIQPLQTPSQPTYLPYQSNASRSGYPSDASSRSSGSLAVPSALPGQQGIGLEYRSTPQANDGVRLQQLTQLNELEGKIGQLTASEQQLLGLITQNQATASQQYQRASSSKGLAAGLAITAAVAAQVAEQKNRSTLRNVQDQLVQLRTQATQLRNLLTLR